MIDTSLTRVYLESLSAAELLQLADKFNIDIPAGLERVFLIEALLESAFGNEEKSESIDNIESDFFHAVALPRQYNISFIDVMIRDPLWAFAFWEIKSHKRDLCEKSPEFEGYCLKVVPIRDANAPRGQESPQPGDAGTAIGSAKDDSFIVPVGLHDSGLYLNFPPGEGFYRLELCALYGEKPVQLIASRAFRMPKVLELPNQGAFLPQEFQELYRNPLACLSGARDFPVIRNAERVIRIRESKKTSTVR